MNKYLVLLLAATLAFASCKANTPVEPMAEVTEVVIPADADVMVDANDVVVVEETTEAAAE